MKGFKDLKEITQFGDIELFGIYLIQKTHDGEYDIYEIRSMSGDVGSKIIRGLNLECTQAITITPLTLQLMPQKIFKIDKENYPEYYL